MRKQIVFFALMGLLVISGALISCTRANNSPSALPVPTAMPTDDPNTMVNESIVPGEGQPQFPQLGQYWVADPNGDCNFTSDTALWANDAIEKLRKEKDVWLAVLCQPGIKKISGFNDERIWMVDWVRWFRLGSAKKDWAVFIVFRPDVKPEENRVLIERTYGLTWFSPVVYHPIIERAAKYANVDDYDGALESIISQLTELTNATFDLKNIPTQVP